MILDIRVFGYLVGVPDSTEWFLAAGERGNFATSIPDWSTGNRVEPLIHGATYFDRLATAVAAGRL